MLDLPPVRAPALDSWARNMTEQGLVSVIIPVRDRPRLLEEAAASVFAQSYPHWELLIIDDASVDSTPKVARTLAALQEGRVRVLTGEGRGPGPARDLGRRAAAGEFLQYLDSDDLLKPRKLELHVDALKGEPGAGLAYCPVEVLDFSGRPRRDWQQLSDQPLARMFPRFLRGRFWHTGAALLRREVSDLAGPWSDLSLFEDWEYDCRLAALDRPLAFVDEVGVTIRSLAPNRLGFGDALAPRRLIEQARAHELILAHARRSGIPKEAPEMEHFARALFLMARKCGLSGLRKECLHLLNLAREASTPERARGADFLVYWLLVSALGTRAGSEVAERLSRMRSKGAGEGGE